MAKLFSKQVSVYFAGFDLGTATTSTMISLELEALDKTALGDGAETVIAGIRHDQAEWSGLYDDGTSMDAAGSAMIGSGTNNVLSVHIGTTIGSRAYAGTALLLMTKPLSSVKGLVQQEAIFKPDQSWDRGQTQLLNTSFTGSGSSGSIDNAALTTGGGKWYLHVFTYSGGGTTVVSLEDSADAASWAAVGTVGAISARSSYRNTFTGTLRRYTRVTKTATGTAQLAAVVVRD